MIEDNKVKNKELYDRTKNRRPSLTKNPFTLRITGIKIGNLDRWKLIQKMQQNFWVKCKEEASGL